MEQAILLLAIAGSVLYLIDKAKSLGRKPDIAPASSEDELLELRREVALLRSVLDRPAWERKGVKFDLLVKKDEEIAALKAEIAELQQKLEGRRRRRKKEFEVVA